VKVFTKTISKCEECPNFRSDKHDPNPDVGMGRGDWCGEIDRDLPTTFKELVRDRGLKKDWPDIPAWCPLSEEGAKHGK